jgi:hypothetical protein
MLHDQQAIIKESFGTGAHRWHLLVIATRKVLDQSTKIHFIQGLHFGL